VAELVGVFAASHAPLIARDWSRLPTPVRLRLSTAMEELGRRLMAVRPDILIEISPDHWVNFSLTHLPSVCVGVGAEHSAHRNRSCAIFRSAGNWWAHRISRCIC
jgi:hypothetical protein